MGGQHFVVRVYPQFRPEERRSESYTSTRTMVERLVALGVPRMDPDKSFPDAGGILDAVWTSVDVPSETFTGFGGLGSRSSGAPIAA
jgi:hypothetical protein